MHGQTTENVAIFQLPTCYLLGRKAAQRNKSFIPTHFFLKMPEWLQWANVCHFKMSAKPDVIAVALCSLMQRGFVYNQNVFPGIKCDLLAFSAPTCVVRCV